MKYASRVGRVSMTALVVMAGVIAAAWIGRATGGPLDPPAGALDNGTPVETSPSLAELEAEIDGIAEIAGFGNYPPNLQVAYENGILQETRVSLTDVVGLVRLHSIVIYGGAVSVVEQSTGRPLASIAGNSQILLGGVEVHPPLNLSSFGIQASSQIYIYYWQDPEP